MLSVVMYAKWSERLQLNNLIECNLARVVKEF
jgi:hypothetical protein